MMIEEELIEFVEEDFDFRKAKSHLQTGFCPTNLGEKIYSLVWYTPELQGNNRYGPSRKWANSWIEVVLAASEFLKDEY